MKIQIIAVGKIKEKIFQEKIEDYFKKLGKGVEILIKEIPAGKAKESEQVKKQEAMKILELVSPKDFVVALDERGKEASSEQFARLLEKLIHQSWNLTLVIGGAYGLDQAVRERADLIMALSRLTFSHELARLVLAEQIFRAFSIIKGNPYHH